VSVVCLAYNGLLERGRPLLVWTGCHPISVFYRNRVQFQLHHCIVTRQFQSKRRPTDMLVDGVRLRLGLKLVVGLGRVRVGLGLGLRVGLGASLLLIAG